MTLTAPGQPQTLNTNHTTTIAEAIEQSLLDCCRLCLAQSEGTELHDDETALWFRSGVRFPLYNGIYRPHFPDAGDDPEAIKEAIHGLLAPFKETNTPMVLCTGPSSKGQDMDRAIRKQGLIKVASIPGMAMAIEDLDPMWAQADGLTIKQVRTEDDLRDWVGVQNDCFGFPSWVADATYRMTRHTIDGVGPVRLYLGRYNEIPVATSMAVDSPTHIGLGIFNVATIPEARRRGFGAAISAHPIVEAARTDHTRAILHATPEGLPVYEKMGFVTHCHLDNYLYAPMGLILSLGITTIQRKIAHTIRKYKRI